MTFNVELQSRDGAAIRLALSGRLEAAGTQSFHSTCRRLLSDAGRGPVVLDLSGLSYIDSGGIGALMVMHDRAQTEGRSLALANCNGDVIKVLKLLNLHRVLNLV